MNPSSRVVVIGAFAGIVVASPHMAGAAATNPGESANQVVPGIVMPSMDPVRGKQLFASKGCVVCHSINGVGGTDARRLDAATMPSPMNPFEFFARMWRGALPMVMMQTRELGHQIEFNGQELGDIVAFAHNPTVQKTFSTDDIPPGIKRLMAGDKPK